MPANKENLEKAKQLRLWCNNSDEVCLDCIALALDEKDAALAAMREALETAHKEFEDIIDYSVSKKSPLIEPELKSVRGVMSTVRKALSTTAGRAYAEQFERMKEALEDAPTADWTQAQTYWDWYFGKRQAALKGDKV